MLRATLLAAWLAMAPTAQAQSPEPPMGNVLEVEVGAEQIVPIPTSEEVLVMEADGIVVTQLGPDSMRVEASRPGRAVVMLRGPSGFTSLVIRAKAVSRAAPPPVHDTSGGSAELELGGAYEVYGVDDTLAGVDMTHWLAWRQTSARLSTTAFIDHRVLPTGQHGIQDLGASVYTPEWGVEAGDISEMVLPSVEGINGSQATLRGARGFARIGDTGLSVGGIVGAGRRLGCCEFWAPDELIMGALTGAYERGAGGVDVLGGVMLSDDAQRVDPLVRLGGHLLTEAVTLRGMVTQSGPGTGGGLTFSARATPQLQFHADAAAHTANFVRPLGIGTGQFGEIGGVAGLRYLPSGKVVLTADLKARYRGDPSPTPFDGGGRFRIDWRPVNQVALGAAYQRSLYVRQGQFEGGDSVQLQASWSPRRWYVSGSAFLDIQPPDRRSAYVGAGVGWRPTKAWAVDAGYRIMTFESAQRTDSMGQAWTGVDFHVDAFSWMLQLQLTHTGGDSQFPTRVTASTFATWHVRRFLDLGLGGHVTTPTSFDVIQWTTSAFWTLRPFSTVRGQGGLGLRGHITGVVFLDENRNGVQDKGEDGLPDMTVTVDGDTTGVTDESGRFSVAKLAAGPHEISLDRGTYHSIGATRRPVDVAPFESNEQVFALTWGGRIQGLLYDDIHGDGTYDNGDPGVRAELVQLRNAQGVVVGRVFADGGRFSFSGLEEGEYTVMIDAFGLPEGYTPVDDLEPMVFVEGGKAINLFIRLHANRAIGGVVWEDTDRDGQGAGKKDLGIGGAEVYLSSGEVVRTGPDGSFLFRDLPPGAYAVRTELSTEAKVVVLPVEPKEVLDLTFVLPKGTKPPDQNVNPSPKAPDSVAGLVLEAPMSVLPQGVEVQVTATAVLSNGETREVSTRANWSSSDPATLHVSPEGKVSGHAAGTAGVTAEWKGGVGDPLTFEVLGSPLDRITVSPVGLRLNPGNTADLRVDVVDRSGRGGEVTPVAVWEVADTRVARVDATGRLKAVRDGITTVRARIGDTWSAPLEIQVITAEVTALSIENLPARMPEGATVQLKATGYDTRLEIQNVTESVTWSSSDPAVVRVEPDGRIIAVGRGTAQITAAIGSLFTRSRTVFVTNTPPLALDVVPPGMTISIYDLQRFRATATFEDGSKGAVTTVVEWLVEGNAAIVRADGTVVPREPGTVTVRARYLGVESAPVVVTVTQ